MAKLTYHVRDLACESAARDRRQVTAVIFSKGKLVSQLTARIEERLRHLTIEYRLTHHEPTTTSEESALARGVSLSSGAKALVVKAGDNFSLFVVPADRQLDWKPVKRLLGSRSARLASADELLEKTGLVKGSVPPFGNLLGLPTYVDSALLEEEFVRFNAGSLTASIEIPGKSLQDAVEGQPGVYTVSPAAPSGPASSPDRPG